VLKAMTLSRVKTTTAALLLALTLAGAGFWQAPSLANGQAQPRRAAPAAAPEVSGKVQPVERVRVTVTEGLKDEDTVVPQVGMESMPGAKLEVLPDKEKRGVSSFSLSTGGPDPDRPKARRLIQLVFLVDHVQGEWKGGSANAVKFLFGHKIGGISSST